jgi:hypothetical protein
MIRFRGIEFDKAEELVEYIRLTDKSETKEEETPKKPIYVTRALPQKIVPTQKLYETVEESILEKFKSMFKKEEGLRVAVALYNKAKEKGLKYLDLDMAREVCPDFPNFKEHLICSYYRTWVNNLLDGSFDEKREKRRLHLIEIRKSEKQKNSGKKKFESFRRNFIDNKVKSYMSQDRFLTIEGARAKADMDFKTRMTEKAKIMRAKRTTLESEQGKPSIPTLNDEQRDLFIRGMNDLAQGTISKIDKEYLQNLTATFYTKDMWSGFLAQILPLYPKIAKYLGIPDKFMVENYCIVYR